MASPERLTSAPLVQIAASLHRRRLSPVELVDAYTRRIEAAADLHAFITPPGDSRRRRSALAIWTSGAKVSVSIDGIRILGRHRRPQLFDQRQVPLPCWQQCHHVAGAQPQPGGPRGGGQQFPLRHRDSMQPVTGGR